MKLIKTLLFSATLLFTSATAGNVDMGMKIYGKKMKEVCGVSGVKFTATYTPVQWQKLYDEDMLVEAFKAICPNIKEYRDVWTDHLFAFVYEYGKGSGNEPTCG